MRVSIRPRLRRLLSCTIAAAMSHAATASAQGAPPTAAETLFVYGPGGPLPAMREAARDFARARGVAVLVTGGPTPQWLEKAKQDADMIFSGSEHMMTDFVGQLKDAPAGAIVDSTIVPLYLRPAAILVRKGNPRRIRRFEDLLRPGVKVLVVQGAGQTGMWEDVAGRTGDISVLRAFRRNIGAYAPNSGEAKRLWTEDRTFDAWLIWNIWQVANPEIADVVPLAPKWVVYRDAGVALTRKGLGRQTARAFVEHLRSAEGARTFRTWGWSAAR
jgi:accessory colonization factor AcfC